jgi:hypothetical protein
MKNKHLVLLFFAALAIGLLLRGMPWNAGSVFETTLVKIDTGALSQVVISLPGAPELGLERTEQGWTALQNTRSTAVLPGVVASMIAGLTGIKTFRIIKSELPDTLGLRSEDAIQVDIWQGNKTVEQIRIGRTILLHGQPSSFMQMRNHDEIYLVAGDMRRIFKRTLEDFRKNTVADFNPASIRAIQFEWPHTAPAIFVRQDSANVWQASSINLPAIPGDSVRQWLDYFRLLNRCHFADYFDGNLAADSRLARITLYEGNLHYIFDFYHTHRQDLPEEYTEDRHARQAPANFFVHSSLNPDNYFALPDTNLARVFCFSLRSPQ